MPYHNYKYESTTYRRVQQVKLASWPPMVWSSWHPLYNIIPCLQVPVKFQRFQGKARVDKILKSNHTNLIMTLTKHSHKAERSSPRIVWCDIDVQISSPYTSVQVSSDAPYISEVEDPIDMACMGSCLLYGSAKWDKDGKEEEDEVWCFHEWKAVQHRTDKTPTGRGYWGCDEKMQTEVAWRVGQKGRCRLCEAMC